MKVCAGVLACLLAVQVATADQLQWNNVDWQAGELSQSFDVGGINVGFAFSGSVDCLIEETNDHYGPLPDDDHGWNVDGLWWGCNMMDASDYLTLTISFDQPVSQVQFSIYDIDGMGNNWEKLLVDASYQGQPATVAFSNVGSGITANGNLLASNGSYEGVPGETPNTADVDLSISTMVDTISLQFTCNAVADRGQLIGDIAFVPEPLTTMLLVVGGVGVLKRRG